MFLSDQMLQDGKTVDSMVIAVDYMSVGPLSHFSGYEVSFLFRRNPEWNTATVDKEFFKFRYVSLG